jgi:peptidoglycan/LPS O-acetylase OafA/YrhL
VKRLAPEHSIQDRRLRAPPNSASENRSSDGQQHYRPDIDGLRAIAVLAVIVFHLGWLPYGYLGVDVFFVISGYLITGICLREVREGRFGVWHFYLRRIRRILPLVSVIVAVSLGVGCITMLPDDLENLAQSVIATNLCANNILQAITTRNYWDVINEFKPLMHTWSLGVEEQFYLLYPIILWALAARTPRLFWSLLAASALVSLGMFLVKGPGYETFYFIQYRFFELAAGGILVAVLGDRPWRLRTGWLWLAALSGLLVVDLPLPPSVRLLLVVAATLALLVGNNTDRGAGWAGAILTHPIAVNLGLMSFSLYMWHQVLLAYTRYCVVPVITPKVAVAVLGACLALSWLTWRFVERPFRDPRKCSTAVVLTFVAMMMLVTTGAAGVIYARAGVIRDVPELDVSRDDFQRGMHAAYNHRIHAHDQRFSTDGRLKVLVIGNSFMRDWANVLLESTHGNELEVSYRTDLDEGAWSRIDKADIVYVQSAEAIANVHGATEADIWVVGTKSFGTSTGIHYNRRRDEHYCAQRTLPEPAVALANESMRALAGDRYIDLMGRVTDAAGTVPVFTPDCKFISQDTRHFTRAGATYFAELFTMDINDQIRSTRRRRAQ